MRNSSELSQIPPGFIGAYPALTRVMTIAAQKEAINTNIIRPKTAE
jgi:hypothetical protein